MTTRSARGQGDRVRELHEMLDDFNWSWKHKNTPFETWRASTYDWEALGIRAREIPWDVVCRSWTDYCPFPKEHGAEPPLSWRGEG